MIPINSYQILSLSLCFSNARPHKNLQAKICFVQTDDSGDKCCRCRKERQERAEERFYSPITIFIALDGAVLVSTSSPPGAGLARSAPASSPMADF